MNTIVKNALTAFINKDLKKAKDILAPLAEGYGEKLIDKNNNLTSIGLDEALHYPLPVNLKKILKTIIKNKQDFDFNANEHINLLTAFEFINERNQLTQRGYSKALECIPLPRQCSELLLDLETIELVYDGNPEQALLSYYESQGYTGLNIEGVGIITILKAIMLNLLHKYNSFKDREDACVRALEAQFSLNPTKLNEIILSISSTTRQEFIDNFKEIISKPFIASRYPELSLNFATAIYDSIDKNIFIAIAKKIAETPYTYRNGWPDLTLIKDNKVSFVEVKATDKLHISQLITIPIMREITQLSFHVCKVIKKIN
jgi:hypothetical protein